MSGARRNYSRKIQLNLRLIPLRKVSAISRCYLLICDFSFGLSDLAPFWKSWGGFIHVAHGYWEVPHPSKILQKLLRVRTLWAYFLVIRRNVKRSRNLEIRLAVVMMALGIWWLIPVNRHKVFRRPAHTLPPWIESIHFFF